MVMRNAQISAGFFFHLIITLRQWGDRYVQNHAEKRCLPPGVTGSFSFLQEICLFTLSLRWIFSSFSKSGKLVWESILLHNLLGLRKFQALWRKSIALCRFIDMVGIRLLTRVVLYKIWSQVTKKIINLRLVSFFFDNSCCSVSPESVLWMFPLFFM